MTAGSDPDIVHLLRWGVDYLKSKNINDSVISAESLLGHVLEITRSELLLNPNRRPDDEQAKRYRALIQRRGEHVPLQYLTGYTEFYNVRIKCDPRALIPRPETEILVEVVIDRIEKGEGSKILDIGIGSGNIAIALAKNIPGCEVTGVDISEKAIRLAEENARFNKVEDKIELVTGDILDRTFTETFSSFDCIVSNPPYVAEGERPELEPEVAEYEPSEALFSFGDPLKFSKAIIESAPGILKPGGLLAFEIGMGQDREVMQLMSRHFSEIRSYKDLAGIERVVTGRYSSSNS